MKMLQRLRKAEAAAAGKDMAGSLILYDRSLNRDGKVDRYDEAHFASNAIRQPIETWPDVMASLTQYFSIRNLVFFLHSDPRGFLFGPNANATRFKSITTVDQAAVQLRGLQGKPEVLRVDLEGCNLGFDLNAVVRLGLALDADEIKATNHFHEFALDRLKASKQQARELERELLRLRGYIATPGTDSLLELVKTKPVDQIVLLEWFVAHDDESEKNLPTSGKINAKVFKPLSSAHPETIATQEKLDALQKEFAMFSGQEPIRRLIRVTIMLDQFRGKSPAQPSGSNRQLVPAR
jgi:hypothetical protein